MWCELTVPLMLILNSEPVYTTMRVLYWQTDMFNHIDIYSLLWNRIKERKLLNQKKIFF